MATGQSNSVSLQQVSNQWLTGVANQFANHASENFSKSFTSALDIVRIRFDRPIIDITDYSSAYNRMENSIAGAAQAQNNLSAVAKSGTEEAKKQASVWEKVTNTFNKAKGSFNKVKGVAEKFLKPAAEEEKWESMFKAKTGNDEVGQAMFDKFKQKSVNTGQDLSKSMEGVLTLYPKTQNTEQLEKLMDYSTILSKMSPKGKTISDASSAIASVFKGETGDLADLLQINKTDLNGLQLVAKTENMEAFLSTLGDIMTTAGMTSGTLETMMDSPVSQWQSLLGNYKSSLAGIGDGLLQGLAPLIVFINQAFENGTFQPVIDGLSAGLSLLTQGFYEVVQGALWLWNVLSGTLPAILPILLGIVAGVIAYKMAMLAAAIVTNMSAIATRIATVAQGIYNAVLNANPIALIIGLIVGLIIAILGIVAALQPVREFLAQAFQWIGEITAAWVGYCIDLWTSLANKIIEITNFLLSGVNKAISAFGKVLGIEASVNLQLEKIDSSKFKDFVKSGIVNIHDTAAEGIQNFSVDNLKNMIGMGSNGAIDQTTLLQDWNMEHPGDTSIIPKSTNVPTVPTIPAGNSNQMLSNSFMSNQGFSTNNNINRVNEVGSIKQSVDISSDDLKMLRELAEIQAVQNFVELTPTVQVTTGNINNAGDIDTIISKINQKLNEEFVATAQGVYT